MEKQHPYMSPLYVFVQLYFSSLLRSLRHKLWWKYILFQFHYYLHYINNIFFFISLYVHYAVIKTKSIIFLVNNKINFATTFTAPGSWKVTYFYTATATSTTTITTCTTAWFWQKKKLFWPSYSMIPTKKIILTFTTFIFLLHLRLLLPSPCHNQDNSFFISLLRDTSWSKEK